MVDYTAASVDGSYQPINLSQGPSNKIQLSISCRNLVDLDILSKSDPQVFLYIKDSK